MLIVIHGLGGSSGEMKPLARAIAPEGLVLAPTLLGHGGRPLTKVGGYEPHWADLQAQLADARDALLVGYSLGGYHALRYARLHPERVRGVVAIGTRVHFDGSAFDYLRHVITPERLFGNDPARKARLEDQFGSELTREKLARALAVFERLQANPPLADGDLAAIEAPVLLISGREDQLAPESETRRIAACLPNARIGLFPGRGHPIDLLPFDRVTVAIRHFFREIDEDRFVAGGESELGETLVAGGQPAADLRATFRIPSRD